MAKRLYVGNLSYDATEDELRELFSQAGEVSSVTLLVDRETGRPRGFGFIEMTDNDAAVEAIKKFDGYNHRNRQLRVSEARPQEGGRSTSSSGGFGGGSRERRGSGGYERGGNRNGGRGNRGGDSYGRGGW